MSHDPEVSVRPGMPLWKLRIIFVLAMVIGVGVLSGGGFLLLRVLRSESPGDQPRALAGEGPVAAGPVTAEVINWKVEDPSARSLGRDTTLGQDVLAVTIRFTKTDPTTLKDFDPSKLEKVTAVDNYGNTYPQVDTGFKTVEGVAKACELDTPIRTRLLFRKPLRAAEWVDIDVPGLAVGVEAWYRFRIPLKGK